MRDCSLDPCFDLTADINEKVRQRLLYRKNKVFEDGQCKLESKLRLFLGANCRKAIRQVERAHEPPREGAAVQSASRPVRCRGASKDPQGKDWPAQSVHQREHTHGRKLHKESR